MLVPPPPDRETLDRNALEPEGRKKYLQSLENRLNKLEGRGNKITSKDMLAALSEARDDHLSGGHTMSDPWTRENTNVKTTAVINEYAEMELSDVRNTTTTTSCCCCSWGGGRGYIRGRKRKDFNLEEYSCLVECDELEWNMSHDQSKQSNQFDDNFVCQNVNKEN